MSVPVDTLWYNGDWDLFIGINDVTASCPCTIVTETNTTCVSRPVNELNEPTLLMGTFTDFIVTDMTGWRVTKVFSNNFTVISQADLNTLQATYQVREGVSAGDGGTLIASGTSVMTVTPTGRTATDGPITYTEYQFLVIGLNIILPPGTYWVNVLPIIPQTLIDSYGSDFLIFNSTTTGTNAIGIPPGNNNNDFVSIQYNPQYFIPSTEFGSEYGDFSNGVAGIVLPMCIDPDMYASMFDGSLKQIRELVPGELLMSDIQGIPSKLVINYRNPEPHRVLVKLLADSIAPNVPNRPLLITTNHKIIINGVPWKPRDLINGTTISRSRRPSPINTHTLVTEDGRPVLINNVLVYTWSIDSWNHGLK